MSVVTRGVKNAFRNWLRTLAVVLILAIGIGLSLSMLVANQAVGAKIDDLKTKVGNTLSVNPAGSQGMQGGGEPLKTADVTTVSKVAHVSAVDALINVRLRNQDSSTNAQFGMRGGDANTAAVGTTNLTSPIDPGTLGRRFAVNGESGATLPANFSLPVSGYGITGGYDQTGTALKITSGRALTASDTGDVAVVGTGLATKNNLTVGSTFTAYAETFTVVGIFDQGTQFENAGFGIPLSTAQRLTGQTDEVDLMVVQVDSADNLTATQTAIKNALGADRADVTSTQQNVQTAIDSLQSVQQISIIAFVGALVAAAVITFLIMLMIVRERKREIGVLKAIGGSNTTIVGQFIVESLVFVVLGTIVGFGVSLLGSNGIANALVSGSVDQSQTQAQNSGAAGGFQGRGQFRALRVQSGGNALQTSSQLVGQVVTSVGPLTLLYGLLAAIGIAVVGSAIPVWLIAKVRPAEVMRGE